MSEGDKLLQHQYSVCGWAFAQKHENWDVFVSCFARVWFAFEVLVKLASPGCYSSVSYTQLEGRDSIACFLVIGK